MIYVKVRKGQSIDKALSILKKKVKESKLMVELREREFYTKPSAIRKEKNSSEESQNMRDAKTIGFSIGNDNVEQSKGGVKKKLAIFNIEMQQYYDYVISDTLYNNYPCYVFSVNVKDTISAKMKERALIRKIVSFFDKKNLNVIFREYIFKYKNWFIDLDINVVVHMDYVNSFHLPIKVEYRGFWDVIFFKTEKAEFSLVLSDYITE